MSNKGFTLVEIMFVSALLIVISAGMMKTYIAGQRSYKAGLSELDVQRVSKLAIEKMGRRLRNAKSITLLSANGNSLEFAWDDPLLWTPTNNADDITSGFYYVDADNNPATIADNSIFYDSDVDDGGNALVTLVSNISPTNNQDIFSTVTITPNRVRMRFTVFDSYAADGYQGIDINSVVELRNYTNPYP